MCPGLSGVRCHQLTREQKEAEGGKLEMVVGEGERIGGGDWRFLRIRDFVGKILGKVMEMRFSKGEEEVG